MTLQIPDRRRPGAFFTIRNPESILATHGESHRACPICSFLRDQIRAAKLGAAAAWQVPRPSVTDTQPLSLADIQNACEDTDIVCEGPVGFEIVEVGVKDDADASGKIARIEKAKGVAWVN